MGRCDVSYVTLALTAVRTDVWAPKAHIHGQADIYTPGPAPPCEGRTKRAGSANFGSWPKSICITPRGVVGETKLRDWANRDEP